MNQSGYTSGDMLSMQADAIRRVREMQRRARQQVAAPAPAASSALPRAERSAPPSENEGKDGSPLSGLLSSLDLDNDRLLLLALIFLLAHEGADSMLILALLYIMM